MPQNDASRRTVLKLLGGVAGSTALAGAGLAATDGRERAMGAQAPTEPTVEWVRRYGDREREYHLRSDSHAVAGQSVVRAGDGYAIGTDGTTVSESGESDESYFALVRADADGELRWVRFLDDGVEDTEQNARDLAATADGGFVVVGEARPASAGSSPFEGETQTAGVVVGADAEGNRQWARVIGLADRRNYEANDPADAVLLTSVDALPDGGVVVGGVNAGYPYVARLDAGGELVWERQYDHGERYTRVDAVRRTADGGVAYVTDDWLGKLSGDGAEQWVTKVEAATRLTDLVQTDDGGFAVTGDVQGTQDNPGDFLLVKVDSGGSHAWTSRYDGPYGGTDLSRRLVRTGDGGFALAGEMQEAYSGDRQPAVVKAAPDGTEQWRLLASEADGRVGGLVTTADGVAFTNGASDQPSTPLLAKVAAPSDSGGSETPTETPTESPTETDEATPTATARPSEAEPTPTDRPSSGTPTATDADGGGGGGGGGGRGGGAAAGSGSTGTNAASGQDCDL